MNKRTRGILLLAAGFVMLFAAVALYWAYDDRDRLAGETSAALLQELEADPAPPAITEEVTITTPEGYELLGAVHIQRWISLCRCWPRGTKRCWTPRPAAIPAA